MSYTPYNWQTGEIITANKLNSMEQGISSAVSTAEQIESTVEAWVGSPLVAATKAAMTDTNKIYVYTGSESGMTAGNWYYYNGSNWVSGGVYNSAAVQTDTTLSVAGVAADAAAAGYIKTDLSAVAPDVDFVWTIGSYISSSGSIVSSDGYATRSAITGLIKVRPGDQLDGSAMALRDAENHTFTLYTNYYIDGVWQSRASTLSGNKMSVVPENINGIRFSFNVSTITMTSALIADYFKVKIYKKACALDEAEATTKLISDQAVPKMFLYTDYKPETGFWMAGGVLTNTYTHTQKLKIIPGGKCYMSQLVGQTVQGVWFDINGKYISDFVDTDASDYSYPSPNAGSGTEPTYVTMKEFTAPAAAYYLSLNIKPSVMYRNYVASKPVYALANTGNIVIYDDASYQYTKGRKLCCIGPSLVMIDRALINTLGTSGEYLCGWQEYVAPWYSSVDNFGFSGGSMGTGYTAVKGIYDGIVNDQVDMSGYDDIIIFASGNGVSQTGVGDWGTVEAGPGETDSYMGGLRGLVDYILNANPMARIFLTTYIHTVVYFTYPNSDRPRINDLNDKTRDMAEAMGLPLIDLAKDVGFNKFNYYNSNDPNAGLTYDGTHYNQAGSRVVGLAVRKAIAGA